MCLVGILCSGILALAGGCAQRSRLAILEPHQEEIPNLEHVRPTNIQATVKVAGRNEEPVVPLVPDLSAPELTAEEKAAVGEDKPVYKALLHEYLVRKQNAPVSSTFGGAEVQISGVGGAVSASEPWFSARYGVGDWGAMTVGVGTSDDPRGAVYDVRDPRYGVGTNEATQIGYGPASEITRHDTGRKY